MKRAKSEIIKSRVSAKMKQQISKFALARGESEAVIVREAITYYIRAHASRAA